MRRPGQLLIPRGTGNYRAVAPGFLSGLLPFTRSQSSVIATAPDASGSVISYSANAPRFIGTNQGLLLEGQRTNAITNPRCVGSGTGTPGSLPTNWSFSPPTGATRSITGFGTINGVDYVDIRISGTTTATSLYINLNFDTAANAPAITNTQTIAGSVYLAIVNGTLPGGGINMVLTALDAARASLSSWPALGSTINPTSTLTRYTRTGSPTHPSTAFAILGLWSVGATSGTTLDFTLRVGWPQCEANVPQVSSHILPLVGATGATTRGHDQINEPFTEAFPGSVGTILGRTTLDTSTSVGQAILQLDDGTLNNRITFFNDPGNTNITLATVKAGTGVNSGLASTVNGTPFNWGFTFNGTNTIASLNGGAPVTNTNYPNAITRMLVNGIATNGSNPMFGTLHHLELLPYAVSSSQLQSLVANIPT